MSSAARGSGRSGPLGALLRTVSGADAEGVGPDLLGAILESAGALVYVKDLDGRYVFVNRRFEEVLGRDRADILGGDDDEVWPAELAAAYRANDEAVLRSGEVLEIEEPGVAGDHAYPLITVKAPLLLGGEVVGVCGISCDVTTLRNAESERSAIVQAAPDAIVALDGQGRVLELNPAGEALLGRSRDRALSQPLERLLFAAGLRAREGEVLRGLMSAADAPGPVPRAEVTAMRSDGREVPVEVTVTRTSAVPARYVAFVRDITDRRRAELEAGLFRVIDLVAILDRMADGFVALDSQWRYRYLNEPAARMLGRRREDLLGRHIWTEFPEGVGQPFHRAYERAMAEQVPFAFESFYPPWGRWFENRLFPSTEGLTIVFTDVTDRIEARRSLERWGHAFADAQWGMAVLDPDGRLELVNRAYAEMHGVTADELVGLPVGDLYAPGAEPAEERLRRLDEAGHLSFEVEHARADGTRFTVSVDATSVRGADGEVLYRVANVQDMTDRLRTQRELEERNERIAALAAERARLVVEALEAEERERRRLSEALHDGVLQTLLSSLQDLAEADGPDGAGAVGRATGAVRGAVDQLRETVALLHPVTLAYGGLGPALEVAAALLAEQHGFRARVHVEGDRFGARDTLILGLARELLTNAGRHARATEVTLTVRSANGSALVEVADDGSGFEPKRRHAAILEGHIGLASWAERVQALGGTLDVETAPGAGTRVRAVVPLDVAPAR